MSIWPIITKTAHTSAWTRLRRPGDPSNYVLPKRAAFSLDLESAVFITDTIGQKLPGPHRTLQFLSVISGLRINGLNSWARYAGPRIVEIAQYGPFVSRTRVDSCGPARPDLLDFDDSQECDQLQSLQLHPNMLDGQIPGAPLGSHLVNDFSIRAGEPRIRSLPDHLRAVQATRSGGTRRTISDGLPLFTTRNSCSTPHDRAR